VSTVQFKELQCLQFQGPAVQEHQPGLTSGCYTCIAVMGSRQLERVVRQQGGVVGQTWHGSVEGLVGCCYDEGAGRCLVSNTVM